MYKGRQTPSATWNLPMQSRTSSTYTLLKNSAGTFVTPSFDAFEDAADTGTFDPKKHFYLWLVNAPGKNSWPIAGATFILLAQEKTDANRKVVKFYDWAFRNGDTKAKELVYVPLPKSLKDKIRAYWKANGLQSAVLNTGRVRDLPALFFYASDAEEHLNGRHR